MDNAKIKIRLATIMDAIGLYKCNKRNLPLYYTPFEYIFRTNNPSNRVALVESDDEIIGFIVGEFQKENFHILSFGVNEEHRRKKLGTKLIQFVTDNVKDICKNVSLYVHLDNSDAIKFYQKIGFEVETHLKNYYNGILENAITQDAYRMVRKID